MIAFFDHDNDYFLEGVSWEANDDSKHKTHIVRVERVGDGRWDYRVYHSPLDTDGLIASKDLFNFQVRYRPSVL